VQGAVRRILIAVLAILALLAQWAHVAPGNPRCEVGRRLGTRTAEAARAADASVVPVVLVHGLRGSGPSSWGEPAKAGQRPTGVYRQLCNAGYVPGKTLFVCDYREDSLGDYREIALCDLPAAIDAARAASGAAQVDLVTRSMGGLVGRSYVSSPGYRGDVRTLVMIATPNRGSFGAGISKCLEMINLQEQLRHRGTARRSPSERPALPPNSQLIAPWQDEVAYVARQSGDVWEPLFGHYYATAYLLAEAVPGVGVRPQGFYEWLRTRYPGVARVLLDQAQHPPVRPGYVSARAGGFVGGIVPGEGESLTRAYYEMLAIQCARHNFLLGRRLSPPEAKPEPRPGSLLERAVAWLTRFVADRLGRLAREQAQGLGVWAMEHLTGLDPKARAADCLIEETTMPSLGGPVLVADASGGSAGGRMALPGSPETGATPLTANYYLTEWNRHDAARRVGGRGAASGGLTQVVRYVHIAGQITNLWGGLWPDVGANDLIVETSSTWLPLADDDVYHLFPSLVGTNHVWIGASGRPWQALIAALRDSYPVRASYTPPYRAGRSKLVQYSRRGRATAEVYQPCYLELKLPAAGAATARLRYTAEAGCPDLRAWAYLDVPGQGTYRYPLAFVPGPDGTMVAELAVDAPAVVGARLLVGVRAEAGAEPEPTPPPNAKRAFHWELGYDPRGGAVQGPASGAHLPTQASTPAATPRLPAVAVPGAATGRGPAVPIIRATHRDKQTVYVKPVVHVHDRWEWDFGDGTRRVDTDPDCTLAEVSHAYPQPGRYACVARSLAADGAELARYEWQVEVSTGEGRAVRAFRAATLRAPEVELRLEGPLAWVTGRPADYRLRYAIAPPADAHAARAEVAHLYPGREFQMIWEKPGTFVVTGALTLRLVYEDGMGQRSVTNVYTVEQEVRVHATVVTE
jgi:hypothetical protein